jgi:hypothetical protein
VGSNPDGVTGIFHWLNPSGRTIVLGSNKSLTKTNTWDHPGGKGGRCVGLTTSPPSCAVCLEILGASPFWTPKGFSRPVLLYFQARVVYTLHATVHDTTRHDKHLQILPVQDWAFPGTCCVHSARYSARHDTTRHDTTRQAPTSSTCTRLNISKHVLCTLCTLQCTTRHDTTRHDKHLQILPVQDWAFPSMCCVHSARYSARHDTTRYDKHLQVLPVEEDYYKIEHFQACVVYTLHATMHDTTRQAPTSSTCTRIAHVFVCTLRTEHRQLWTHA